MPRDMTQIIQARLTQQAERSLKEARKSVNQGGMMPPLDNEIFRSASEDVFNRNAPDEADEPDYRSVQSEGL